MSQDQGFSRFRLGGVVLLVVAASSIALLWAVQRAGVRAEARQLQAAEAAGPRVRVAVAGAEGAGGALYLSGEAMPYVATTLYAKVSGFLREIRVDKGAAVRAGQVLAVIESPEVDRDAQALKADAENKRRHA
jgi:multidrug efflux pump subunit AcrA (membrane-fusion protein)